MGLKSREYTPRTWEKPIKGRHFNDEEILEVIYLVENNHSLSEIGQHYKKTKEAIYRIACINSLKRKTVEQGLEEYRNSRKNGQRKSS